MSTPHARPAARPRRRLALFTCAVAAALAAPGARADTLVSNLSQPDSGFTAGDNVGQAIMTDGIPVAVQDVIINESHFGPISGEFFTINTANPDGTVGPALYNNFTLSYNSGTGLETATATNPDPLALNAKYFLVLNSPRPGTGNASDLVSWDFTTSTAYLSNDGVTIPPTMTSFFTFAGSTTYFNLADGLQLFQVDGFVVQAVPEPGPLALAAVAGTALTGLGWVRRRRARAGR